MARELAMRRAERLMEEAVGRGLRGSELVNAITGAVVPFTDVPCIGEIERVIPEAGVIHWGRLCDLLDDWIRKDKDKRSH